MSLLLPFKDSTRTPIVHWQCSWLLVGVLASNAVHAADGASAAYSLQVRPSICVSYNSDEPCTMALRVSWQGPPSAEVCLHELMRDPLLQCWQNSANGNLELNFANSGDVQYQLQQGNAVPANPVAVADVKVINRDLRNSRKRRRHVWSIL
ncbi:MAG: DUF3019 domain-containing protein [Pseudomonadota bacterium]